MRTLTIITGARASGKTRKARKITEGYNNLWLCPSSIGSTFEFQQVTEYTEYIVYDGLTYNEINKVLDLFKKTKIEINKPMKKPFTIPIPNIIAVIDGY